MNTFARSLVVVAITAVIAKYVYADTAATLSGIVEVGKERGVRGAEIRITGRDVNRVGKVHTDSTGRYSYGALETGSYDVTLLIDGKVQASVNNFQTKSSEVQVLNFDLEKGVAIPFAKGKHFAQTSDLGTWRELGTDTRTIPAGMAERLANRPNAVLHDMQRNSAVVTSQTDSSSR